MSNQKQIMELIKSFSGQANIITIPRVYIELMDGDINGALLLSQIVYWSDKSKRNDGWFYKSYAEWNDEIGLTQYQVKRAVTALEKLGLIETKLQRANKAPTIHYRLKFGLLTNLIIEKLDNRETLETDYQETSQSDYQETSQSLTSTTTENTTTTTMDGDVFKIYEQEIGPLTPFVAQELEDMEKEYSPDWVVEAIQIASANNVRKLKYVNGILRRWHTEGKGNGARPATELIVKNKDGSFNV